VLAIKDTVKDGMWNAMSNGKRASYLVTEIAAQGELFQYIASLGKFPDPIARYYFLQILDGLQAIHSCGMYHGDLKPENVLLNARFMVKIADFGFAEIESADIKQFRGTEGYMAPEILARVPYSG
jgi:serine/threonine protein kinase